MPKEYIEKGYRRPPKGYKNIDLAKKSMSKLEDAVEKCSHNAPAHTLSAARWLENAFYGREIIEEDYDKLMTRIKEHTRKFIDKCSCIKDEKQEPHLIYHL